jgi:hypothetical protein
VVSLAVGQNGRCTGIRETQGPPIGKNHPMEIKNPHRPNLSSDISASGDGGMNADEIVVHTSLKPDQAGSRA